MSRLDDELGWRQQLKAGDPVVVASRDHWHDRAVKNVTPTRIRTGHLEFTKQDGLEYGASLLFTKRYLIQPDGKHHRKLLAAREAELAGLAFRERRGNVVTRVRSIESPEQLDALEALLDGVADGGSQMAVELASFFVTVRSSNTDEWMEDARARLDAIAALSGQEVLNTGSPGDGYFVLRERS